MGEWGVLPRYHLGGTFCLDGHSVNMQLSSYIFNRVSCVMIRKIVNFWQLGGEGLQYFGSIGNSSMQPNS